MNKPAVCVMLIAPVTACLWGSGCVQAAEESRCPTARVGDLVVTELRTTQTLSQGDGDPIPYGGFVEFYNAGGTTLDLYGLVLVFRSTNGGSITRAIVRDHVNVAPGAYVALSPRDADGAINAPLQPTFGYDLRGSIPGSAQLTISACDTVVDTIIYRALPTSGSWALSNPDGAAPTAAANDDEDAWCVQTGTGPQSLGSPAAANESCEEPVK